ncbi:MAG: VOC family protein, partial [Oscillospiraceae bacterium]|nr:VOC family protein [Oscillospiraceae bacterium]
MSELFRNIDCIQFYVSDLDEGIKYYCDSFGLKLLWRAETSVGLGMENEIAEVVLQTDRKKMNVDFKVESVVDSLEIITASGGKIIR